MVQLSSLVQWVVSKRRLVLLLAGLVTAIALWSATSLRIVIDPGAILPQSHPFVSSKATLEGVFKEYYVIMVTVTPAAPTTSRTSVLEKVRRITDGLRASKGIINSTLLSVAAPNAKAISAGEGGFVVTPFRELLHDPERLRRALDENPLYRRVIVSKDDNAFAVIAEFMPEPSGYNAILSRVEPLIDAERDPSVRIAMSGHASILGQIERFSARMVVLFPAAILIVAFILYGAFRSIQGMLLPLVTANLAVIWALGVMGASGFPLDVFNATTPILILAIAAGHAVQILKRYYEEYSRLRQDTLTNAVEANRLAIVTSVARVGQYMVAASVIASAGFLSLMVFEIRSVKVFGLFTGLGIISALIIELTFMPALRASIRPPNWPFAMRPDGWWWRGLRNSLRSAASQRRTIGTWAAVLVIAALGATQTIVDNSNKANFAPWTQVRKDDDQINADFAGTQALYIMVDTKEADGVKRSEVTAGIRAIQRALEQLPGVGRTISIVDFLDRMHQVVGGKQVDSHSEIPAAAAAQYLLLYSMSGTPEDLRSFVDNDYRRANIKVFVHRDDSRFVLDLVSRAQTVARQHLPPGLSITFAGGVAEAAGLHEAMVRDKLLNICQILFVVFLASSVLFRSMFAGILVLIPLLCAVMANFGLLGWLGIPLNIPTSLIAPMSVGIGADYSIYILSRYREELTKGEVGVVDRTLAGAGMPCLYVAMAVACGYGVLVFSLGFRLHQWLALMITSSMTVSVLAALTLLPALALRFRPNFLYQAAKT